MSKLSLPLLYAMDAANGAPDMFSRKLFLLAMLALALTTAAFANSSVDFGNVGGTSLWHQ
jgi:hypothetical protein